MVRITIKIRTQQAYRYTLGSNTAHSNNVKTWSWSEDGERSRTRKLVTDRERQKWLSHRPSSECREMYRCYPVTTNTHSNTSYFHQFQCMRLITLHPSIQWNPFIQFHHNSPPLPRHYRVSVLVRREIVSRIQIPLPFAPFHLHRFPALCMVWARNVSCVGQLNITLVEFTHRVLGSNVQASAG